MRDLSARSGQWWDEVVKFSSEAYVQWLRAEPLEFLYVQPQGVGDGNGQWGRIEQRAQSMLLASLPTSLKGEILANRATSSVQVLFRIFTRCQPGGLGERAMLLRQLVDPRTPTSMLEAFGAVEGVEALPSESPGTQDRHPRCNLAGRSAGEVCGGDCQGLASNFFPAQLCKSGFKD